MVGVMKEFGTWRNIRFNISSRMHPSGPESASRINVFQSVSLRVSVFMDRDR